MSASTTQSLIDSATHQAGVMLGSLANQVWESYGRFILIFLLIIIITKIFTGKIGSLLYNSFYFGILALIIAIWGWEVLFNTYFALLYPISYFFAGLVLRRLRGY